MLFPNLLDSMRWGVLQVELEVEVNLLPRIDPFFLFEAVHVLGASVDETGGIFLGSAEQRDQ